MKRENFLKALNATTVKSSLRTSFFKKIFISLIAVLLCAPVFGQKDKENAMKSRAEDDINNFLSQWTLLNNPDFRTTPELAAGDWIGNYFEYNDKEDTDNIIGFLEDYKDMLGSMQIKHSFEVGPSTMPKHDKKSVYELKGTLKRELLNADGSIKDLPVTFRFVFRGMDKTVQIVGIKTEGNLKPEIIPQSIKETNPSDMTPSDAPSIDQKDTSSCDTSTSDITEIHSPYKETAAIQILGGISVKKIIFVCGIIILLIVVFCKLTRKNKIILGCSASIFFLVFCAIISASLISGFHSNSKDPNPDYAEVDAINNEETNQTNDDFYNTFSQELLELAESGDPKAQGALGFVYYKGKGVKINYDEAFKWARLAGEQGVDSAQCLVGLFYCIKSDDNEGFKWFELAAQKRYAPALYHIGYMYFFGKGVEKNEEAGIEWLEKAADLGEGRAKGFLIALERSGYKKK